MIMFHIHGRISWLKYCGCEHCDGHEKGRNVDVRLAARGRDVVEPLLLDKLGLRHAEEYDWDDLIFDQLTDADSMRQAAEFERRALGSDIAPTLFVMEDA